jgi:hypothetical protein
MLSKELVMDVGYLWVLVTAVVFDSDGSSFQNERFFRTEKACIRYMLKNECEVKHVKKSYMCKMACMTNKLYTLKTLRVTEPSEIKAKEVKLDYGNEFHEDDI